MRRERATRAFRRRAGAIVLLAAAAVSAAASEESASAESEDPVQALLDVGPLPVRDRFVLNLGLLVFEPAAPDVLEQGRWRVFTTASVFNSWSQSDAVRQTLERRTRRGNLDLEELNAIQPIFPGQGLYHADGQIQSLALSIHRGAGHGVEIWLRGALIDTAGGFTDSVVEGFHEGLGFSDADRETLVRNEYTVYLRAPDGRVLYRPNATKVELSDLALGVRKRLGRSKQRWNHAVEAALGLPTGSEVELAGSGSLDLGVRYLASLRLRRSRLRGAVAAIYHGANDTIFLDAETLLTFWLGAERALGPRTSILFQTSIGQSRYQDINVRRLKDRIFLADLGFKRRLRGRRGALFIALTQNFNLGSSSDFGVHLGWMHDL